ncbi:hypothetical protein QQ008_15610 [Fulvivirgaceae bacterium BMA10]|uniref:DUF4625 domain-containing protein n=1 Tax=Splendidivirga corallicola TaxID=3051826 RepID=A0ABT8KPZ6_9BACT|nr:hypothetical protein [Fulvivirgaceae bacterium BMA10]
MKKAWVFATFISLLATLSCKENENLPNPDQNVDQCITFNITLPQVSNSEGRNNQPTSILFSIKDLENDEIIFSNDSLNIIPFGQGYISEQIEISQGAYALTSFMVLNADGEVTYASPYEGSEKAWLVNEPLPIDFTIGDSSTTLSPEVLKVGETDDPSAFGYLDFKYNVVETFEIDLAVLSDWDGSAVDVDIEIKGFSEDSLELKSAEFSFVEGNTIELPQGDIAYFTLSINHPDYHPLFHHYELNQLMNGEPLELYLSLKSETIAVPFSTDFLPDQHDIKIYLPKNGCDQYLRVDLGGFVSNSMIMLQISYDGLAENYVEIGYNITGSYFIKSFQNEQENICDQISDQFPDTTSYNIFFDVLIDNDGVFSTFIGTWDKQQESWEFEILN